MKRNTLEERKREWFANRKIEWRKERWEEARYAVAEEVEEQLAEEFQDELDEVDEDWPDSSELQYRQDERRRELQAEFQKKASVEDEEAAWQEHLSKHKDELEKQFAEYDSSEKVYIRRQMGEPGVASVPINRISNLHYDTVSGGVQAASRPLLYGLISCTDKEGDTGHSCIHGMPPHDIKVCVLEEDNPELWSKIKQMVK